MWTVVDRVCQPKNAEKCEDVLVRQTVKVVFVDPIFAKVIESRIGAR